MKKTLSLLLTLVMILILCVPSLAAAPGLSNFEKVNAYTPGQFKDVPAGSTFVENIRVAYQVGIMQGVTASDFNAKGNLTIAQTIVMAVRIHNLYYANGRDFSGGSPWYQPYVDYAVENRIIAGPYENYQTPVSRAGFAVILGGALPDEALPQISSIEKDAIPDVAPNANYADAVYRLYRAGILTGSDAKGTFGPFSSITRGAAAAIISRMVDTSLRKVITLKTEYVTLYDPSGNAVIVPVCERDQYLKNGYLTSPPEVVPIVPTVPAGGASGTRSPVAWVINPPGGTGWSPDAARPNYILNMHTGKFHVPGCRSVGDMNVENMWYFYGTWEQAAQYGYVPCGICLK